MKLFEVLIQLLVIFNLKVVGLFNPKHAEKAKRMLFMMSLSSALAKEGIIQENTINSLNSELNLADHSESLLLGRELSTSIWGKIQLKSLFDNMEHEYLSITEIDSVSKQLSEKAPHWVCYDEDKMSNDIRSLLVSRQIHTGA